MEGLGLSIPMDIDSKEANGCQNGNRTVDGHVNGEDSESVSFLPPQRGGISRNSGKKHQKVQWNDRNGDKLAEVLEFLPSDGSDSEDDSDICICCVM